MVGPRSDKKETISLFFVQKRTCTYCKRVKAGQGKGKEHWRRAVMSWQWSMQGAPYYHLLWNMSWWEKLFAKIIAFWFIPKNVDNFTKKKHFYVNFTSPKGLYRHSQICKKGLYRHSQICRFFEHGFDFPLPLFGLMLKKTCKIGAGRFSKTARCDSKIHLLSDPCLIILLPCPNLTL